MEQFEQKNLRFQECIVPLPTLSAVDQSDQPSVRDHGDLGHNQYTHR